MGTSTSSKGPSGGISFDPPWLTDFPVTTPIPPSEPNLPCEQTLIPGLLPQDLPSELAPSRRFAPAKVNLSKYISTGNRDYLKRSLGHYSRKGMGGSHRLSQRMSATAGVGAAIYDLFARTSQDAKNWLDNLVSKNLSIEDATNEIVKHIFPTGGSLDEENSKTSIAYAMLETFEYFPDANLSHLGEDELWFLLENFVAYEAKQRIIQDIGQMMECASAKDMVRLSNDMTSFLQSSLSVQMKKIRRQHKPISRMEVAEMISKGIRDTFNVFEEEL